MPSDITVEMKIQGLPEVMKVLEALPDKVGGKALSAATGKIGREIARQLKAQAPVGDHKPIMVKSKSRARLPGFMRWTVRSTKKKGGAPGEFFVGPRAFYARFLEVTTKGRGGEPREPLNPWFFAAWESINKPALVEKLVEILREKIVSVLYGRGAKLVKK